MRAFFLVSLLIASTFVLACGGDGGADDGLLQVVATTTQLGDFARNVGGDSIALTVLLKADQDAHDFDPSPSQIRSLSEADLVLRNGVGLDFFAVKAVGDPSKIVIVSRGVDLREAGEGDDHAGAELEDAENEAGGHDPHIWFSVSNAKRMVENVRIALEAADAANAGVYRENATRYLASLDTLDAEIKSSVAGVPSQCRKLVTNHDVLGYYADSYGLAVVGSVIPGTSTESRPSASAVADTVRKIREERVPAIFAEASVNPDLIRQVAREANVKLVDDLYADSLGPAKSDGATYIDMMRSNTRKIVEALKGC
jgi:ABC-type Zn uptake system ZnuABC Zn-binding protein ZnuA